jgi:hypothetical protein
MATKASCLRDAASDNFSNFVDFIQHPRILTAAEPVASNSGQRQVWSSPPAAIVRGMEDVILPTEQQRQDARYGSYAAYCIAVLFLLSAVLSFAINWWSDHSVLAVIGAVGALGASGCMIHQARHFCDECKK